MMPNATPSIGNIEKKLTSQGDDAYAAFLDRFNEVVEDCDDQGVHNLKAQLLAEIRMIADEIDDVIAIVRTSRQFEEDFREYSRAHVLLGIPATDVGDRLLRITSVAALEGTLRQQALNDGEIAAVVDLLTREPVDRALLDMFLTKRRNIAMCKLSIFGVWVTWATVKRPEDPYTAVTTNSHFEELAAELGLYPPPQPNEDWLLLTYDNSEKVDVQYPRIFDAAASAPPWNPYFTASTEDDHHGWARDTVTGTLIRPEGIHGPVDADVITDPVKKFEL